MKQETLCGTHFLFQFKIEPNLRTYIFVDIAHKRLTIIFFLNWNSHLKYTAPDIVLFLEFCIELLRLQQLQPQFGKKKKKMKRKNPRKNRKFFHWNPSQGQQFDTLSCICAQKVFYYFKVQGVDWSGYNIQEQYALLKTTKLRRIEPVLLNYHELVPWSSVSIPEYSLQISLHCLHCIWVYLKIINNAKVSWVAVAIELT